MITSLSSLTLNFPKDSVVSYDVTHNAVEATKSIVCVRYKFDCIGFILYGLCFGKFE